jgi:hypothetical protein
MNRVSSVSGLTGCGLEVPDSNLTTISNPGRRQQVQAPSKKKLTGPLALAGRLKFLTLNRQ